MKIRKQKRVHYKGFHGPGGKVMLAVAARNQLVKDSNPIEVGPWPDYLTYYAAQRVDCLSSDAQLVRSITK